MTLLLPALVLLAADPLITTAEASGWKDTGRYDEVEKLCGAFPKRFPGKVRCEKFGTTPEGRPMLALVAGDTSRPRPTVVLIGGIHAGEIDGKDAGFWLLRRLLDGTQSPGVLGKATVVFVPVFNVDGHERFGPNNRPNQNGPSSMGWRVTSQNLNLNRDWMKADAPEMAAMLKLLLKYDPLVLADLHVTDGAKFQPDVALTLEPRFSGTPALNTLGHALNDALLKELTALGHQPLDFYPSFAKDDDPLSGFGYGVPPPRFSQAYWSGRRRIGVLVETHSWKSYALRVKATYDVCVLLLEHAAAQGPDWRKAFDAADAEDVKRGGEDVPIAFDTGKTGTPFDFQGYAYTQDESAVSGKKWLRYDDTKPQVWREQLYADVQVVAQARVPKAGWVIPAGQAALVGEKLKLHGFAFETVANPRPHAPLQTFRVTKSKFRPASYEGRLTVTVTGEWKDEARDVPAGSLFVPSAQKGIVLLTHLLEPTAPDSLMAWGFFNAALEQKEYLEDYVAEEAAREMLKDPKVMADFNAKLKDPEFSKSPEARLAFFSTRHPSFDERLNLVPVYRAEEWPRSRARAGSSGR